MSATKKILLILFCLPIIGFGQNVNIPDANFKAYLVGNTAINTNGDAEIQVSEAIVFNGTIDLDNLNISDLTGIEYFTILTELDCNNNNLTSLDISQNTSLNLLYCANNQLTSLDINAATALNVVQCQNNDLTSLDVSTNTALNTLYCQYNQLTSLDVSTNTALTILHCYLNQLTILDISNDTALIELSCYFNQLTSLDVSNNTALNTLYCSNNNLTTLDVRNGNNTNFSVVNYSFNAKNNPNLYCIDVDNVAWSNANWINIDTWASFGTNCSTTYVLEHTTSKELFKVIDLLGRETKGKKNKPLFYIYDDGSIERKYILE